jgi:dihydrofolate reductase
MRKVVVSAMVSLDGVMQAPGGPEEDRTGGFEYGGWVFPYFDDQSGQVMDKLFEAPFDLLLGRKTYEIFAAYWPYIDDPNDTIAGPFNRATKYVVTSSQAPLAWENSVAVRGKVADEIRRLKQQDGPRLLIQGSSQLIRTLLASDLIDEMTLLVFPLVLGKGKKMFGDDARPGALRLTGSQTTPQGVTIQSYVRDGAIKTGSFAAEKPSEAELARRAKWKREG